MFPRDHRIRLAVSNHLWPMMWPTPHRMTMALQPGGSSVVLPVVPLEARSVPRFEPPTPTPSPADVTRKGHVELTPWTVDRSGGTALASWRGEEESHYPWGRMRSIESLRFKVADDRPDRASALGEGDLHVLLPGRTLQWRTRLSLRSDAESFHLRFRRTLAEDGREIRRRDWEETVPRDFQ
jgi:uncharacterized protein